MNNTRKPEKLYPSRPKDDRKLPNAGPHARRELMDENKTPGAGSLPPVGNDDDPNAGSTG